MAPSKSHSRLPALLALALVAASVAAQPARAWTRNVGLSDASNSTTETVKADGSGNTLWAKTRWARGVVAGSGVLEVSKTNSIGNTVWTVPLPVRGSDASQFLAMVLDGSGNPLVAQLDRSGLTASIVLSKLSGASGVVLWSVSSPQAIGSRRFSMATDLQGNLLLGGLSQPGSSDPRIGVTKHRGTDGLVVWSKTVSRTASGYADTFSDIACDSAGNVVVVGTSRVDNPCHLDNPASIVIGKLRGADGQVLWTKTHTTAAQDVNSDPMVRVDQSNNVLVAATALRLDPHSWVFVKRSGSTGAGLYSRAIRLAGFVQGMLTDFEKDATGGVVGVGDAIDTVSDGVLAVKLDNLGSLAWNRILRSRSSQPTVGLARRTRIAVVGGTSVLMAQTRSISPIRPTSQVMVARLALATGAIVWDKPYNGAADSETIAVAVSAHANGDVMVGSHVETGPNAGPTAQPGLVRVQGTNGVLLSRQLGTNSVTPTADFGADLVLSPSGECFATGSSAGRIFCLKTSPAGAVMWTSVYDDPSIVEASSFGSGGKAIVRDQGGNVVVLGTNRDRTVVLKLHGATGARLWARSFVARPGRSVAVSLSGDVFVPFESPSQILKLSAVSGATQWTGVFNGPGAMDRAMYVAVDPLGDVFVSGKTWDLPKCPDPTPERCVVAKFSGSTGGQVWSREVAPPVAGRNEPIGVAVDTGGSVLVAGTSQGAASLDFFAAKLFSSNGDTIWATRFDDAGRSNGAQGMALDTLGNLFVTGTSDADGWTVKALGSSGVQAWANRMTTPTGEKQPSRIVCDGGNNLTVTGYHLSGTSLRQFAQRLQNNTGVPLWTVFVGSSTTTGQPVVAQVSQTNRLNVLGSTFASSSLANLTLGQFEP